MTNLRHVSSRSPLKRQSIVRERKGAMLVFVAIALVVLLGFLAMTLDVGSGNRSRRLAQIAVDAGALAGAVELYRLQATPTVAHDSAVAVATREVIRHGFLASDIVPPCPCSPPISGPHLGDSHYIEVSLSKNSATLFGSIFGVNSLTYAARGVGGTVPFAQDCLVALSPSGSGVEVENGGSLSTTYVVDGHTYSCSIAINSNSGSALDVNNSGQLDAGSSSIGIVGGWVGKKDPSPAPATGTPSVVDPLANTVTMPTLTTCNTTNLATINKDTVLQPGVYCNGITVSSKTTTLSPGVYYMAGGGFTAGTSASIVGLGVTIVTTLDPLGVYAPKGINFSTGCKAKLTASTTAPFSGIVMYGDPAMPTSTVNVFACASDDSPELTGIMYFPTQTLIFDGSNSGTEINGSVIASSIVSSGKVTIQSDLSGSSIVKRPTLVE